MALFWALLCTGLFGAPAYFRLPRNEFDGDPPWHVSARVWIERLELQTYDWRAKELGAASVRSDDVVVVSVDDETVQNAKEGEKPEWAMRPWPRDLAGNVVDQALREGASVVLYGPRVSDVSAHHCAPCRGDSKKSDDELFAARLAKAGAKVVLPFDWSGERQRPGDRALMPFLVRAGDFERERDALARVHDVLVLRAPAWLEPEEGRVVVWAGAVTEARARELGLRLELKGPPVIRSLSPADGDHEVGPAWLTARLAAVTVPGIDPGALPLARSLEAPVPEVLGDTARLGAASLTPGFDGRTRGVPLLLRVKDLSNQAQILATAPLRALMQAEGTEALRYEEGRLKIGERLSVPMQPDGFLLLRWSSDEAQRRGRTVVNRVVPSWRLLVNAEDDAQARGIRHHDNELNGKVVVFSDERDEGSTSVRTPIGRMSRSVLFAQALANMQKGDGIMRVRPEVDFWLTGAFAGMGALLALAWSLTVRRPGWLAWAATLGVVFVLHALAARQLFVEQQRWVAMATPLMACSVAFLASLGYARTLEQGFREFMLRALGGAVRADVFQRVERNLLLMRPERRELTVYIADIEGFTSVAHEQEPKIVGAVLQEYLSEMTEVALDRAGHVDKYLGDGLMAFWGAPVEASDHTPLACEGALALREHFDRRRPDWEKRCGQPIVLRAGLDAGPTLVGEMGTHHRVNYTVLGEPVATAFRLEALAKGYDARILVTDVVRLRAGPQYVFREVDRVHLGRNPRPIDLHELLGRAAELESAGPRLEKHALAFKAYRERRFDEALGLFRALQAETPERVIALHLERCEHFLAQPPPPDWDGVFERRR